MRTAVRLIPLCVALTLLACDARAQPTQAGPERDARCREAALKYVHPSPDKEHLTEEAEEAYEYRQQKMYLRLCGDSDDDFTRSVKESAASYEAARTLERLLPVAGKPGSPESKDPNTYAAIAGAYETHLAMLLRWRKTGTGRYEGAKGFAESIDKMTDLLIDAYARAVAACGARADCQPGKDAWTQKLAGAYRSRHGGSDAGLDELIRGALDSPLPNPLKR